MRKSLLSLRLCTLKLGSSQAMATTKGQDDIAASKKLYSPKASEVFYIATNFLRQPYSGGGQSLQFRCGHDRRAALLPPLLEFL